MQTFQLVRLDEATDVELLIAVRNWLGESSDEYQQVVSYMDLYDKFSPRGRKLALTLLRDSDKATITVDPQRRMKWRPEWREAGQAVAYDYNIKRGELAYLVQGHKEHLVFVQAGDTYKVYHSDDLDMFYMVKPVKAGAKYVVGNDGERIEIGRGDNFAVYEMNLANNSNNGALTFGRTAHWAWRNAGGQTW